MSVNYHDRDEDHKSMEELIGELEVLKAENAVLRGPDTGSGRSKKEGGAAGNRAFLDGIGLGILTVDDRSVITYANKKSNELLNQSKDTLVGAELFCLPEFHFSHFFHRKFDNVKSSGKPERFEESLSSDKRWKYYLSPNSDGMSVVVEDVSENWVKIEAMRVALLSVNSLAEAIFFVHESGHIFHSNEAASQATGYLPEELKSAHIRDFVPALSPDVLRDAGKLTSGHITFESEIQRKDGYTTPVEIFVTGKLLYGAIQYIVSTRDITKRRRVEEDVKDARMQAELYLDLMGHDINNLNQIALGYLELAAEAVKDEEVKALVNKPFEAIQNSSKLIDNVRKLQKMKAGGLKMEAIDMGCLLAELQAQYVKISGRDIIINFKPDPSCRVIANGLMRDVFANLIGNSIKHSDPLRPLRINIILARIIENGKEYCEVAVEDNGPGIPDAQKKTAFGRVRKESVKGGRRGLGLYLVNSLVEEFHGKVRVEDRVPGDHTKGARFVVTLPAAPE